MGVMFLKMRVESFFFKKWDLLLKKTDPGWWSTWGIMMPAVVHVEMEIYYRNKELNVLDDTTETQ